MKKKILVNTVAATILSAQLGAVVLPTATVLAETKDQKTEESTSESKTEDTSGATETSEKEKPTEGNGGVVDPKTKLTSVVTVNGNELTEKTLARPGDTVTWDIVLMPGNKGLLKEFKDTLPEGVKFNPNSDKAVTVYAVNNDGTLGADITSEGKGKIDGKTYSWTPNKPEDFFFVGEKGTKNRLLFHITTVVENSVKPDTELKNIATGVIEVPPTDPEKPNPPEEITDEAIVKTPGDVKKPKIQKSVYLQDKDGKIDLPLPNGEGPKNPTDPKPVDPIKPGEGTDDSSGTKPGEGTDDSSGTKPGEGTDDSSGTKPGEGSEISISSKDDYKKMQESCEALIKLAEGADADINTDKLKELSDGLNEDSTNDDKLAVVAEFKVVQKQYEDSLKKPSKQNAETKESEKKDENDLALPFENQHDMIELGSLEDNYTYVVDVKIPAGSVKESLVIRDSIDNIQNVKAEDVKIYNFKGEDITDQGKVEVKESAKAAVVTWTAGPEYIKYLKENNINVSLQMRIANVNVKDATNEQLHEHNVGGVPTILNTAEVITDGLPPVPSNETIVRPPAPKDLAPSSIKKGVVLQKGLVDPNNPDKVIKGVTKPKEDGKKDPKKEEGKVDQLKDNVTVDGMTYTLINADLTDKRNKEIKEKPENVIEVNYKVKNTTKKDMIVGFGDLKMTANGKEQKSYPIKVDTKKVAPGKEVTITEHFTLDKLGDMELQFKPKDSKSKAGIVKAPLNSKQLKPMNAETKKEDSKGTQTFIDYGKTTVDLKDEDGYVLKAGSEVSRFSRLKNNTAGKPYYGQLFIGPFFGQAKGEIPEQYVEFTETKEEFIGSDSILTSKSYEGKSFEALDVVNEADRKEAPKKEEVKEEPKDEIKKENPDKGVDPVNPKGDDESSKTPDKGVDPANPKGDDPKLKEEGKQVAKPLDFGDVQRSLTLPQVNSYFKYVIDVSVNPDDVKESLVIVDPMDNIQKDSIKAENIKVYDESGKDVTDQFKTSLDEGTEGFTNVTATANKEFVEKVKSAKTNTKLTMVVYNVKFNDNLTKEQKAKYMVNGLVTVENIAELRLDGLKDPIKSNNTAVSQPEKEVTPGTPDPQKPVDPRKPDIKTGIENMAKSPWFIIALATALAGGGLAYYKKGRKKA